MRRFKPLERALFLILAPLWVIWFAAGVKTQVAGGGIALIGLSLESAESYPVVNGEFSLVHGVDPLEQAGLREGDQLLQAGSEDLRGIGNARFPGRVVEQQADQRVTLVYERDGERHETALELLPISLQLPWLAGSFAFALSALVLILRARPTPTVTAYLHGAYAMAFGGCLAGTNRWEAYATIFMLVFAGGVGFCLWIRLAMYFPDDRAPTSRWNAIWPWFFGAAGVFNALAYVWGHYAIANPGIAINAVLASTAILFVATRKYRSGDVIARRQMRWLVVGAYFAALPIAIGTTLAALDPRFASLLMLSYVGVPLFPFFLLIGILSYNLFDVDRLLNSLATYNVIGVLLVGAGLVIVPRAASAASKMMNIDPETGQLALSLVLAALVVPAQRRLRPQVERLFFSERYALDQGIDDLLQELSDPQGPESLTRLTGERLHELLRPESCVVYSGGDEGFAPIFTESPVAAPGFEPDSLLVHALRQRRQPLVLDGAGKRPDVVALLPIDRAALETMRAAVVIPVLRGEALVAFICLGPKRSGDIYTATDLTLLSAVSSTISGSLMRLDQEGLTRQSRAMQESMRRYVPGAVADELASGSELSSGEREISVLFVDIRGYTSFSESRRAEDIFSTINRYTEIVSTIVRKHSGSVVEFNGDGMMAVFGAPRELPEKERSAVAAGREIVDAVSELPVGNPAGGQTQLSVGVGIATGIEFVGNIQAADRMIWTAIGNTTNLAARLQSLSRDLEASLVIDGETFERARADTGDFEVRADVPIRGRREIQDVYALPLPPG